VTTPASQPRENPFIGLRRFEQEDSALFFGRDEEIYDLLRRLQQLHFVAVIGPSGCGKSSLIRAGVLASLRDGYMADGGPWRIVEMQPGNGPLEAWRENLRPHLRTDQQEDSLLVTPATALDTSLGKIAILVDQFEELFEYSKRTGRERDVRVFLDAMLSTGASEYGVYLIITMRSEYLAECARYPHLAEAINEGLYLVPQVTRDQLREAITGPVAKVGAAITVPLVDRLLNDVSGESDALSVLQHALMRMWAKKRPWEPLGLAEYEAKRGLGAFLNDHADSVFNRLPKPGQAAAEALFRAITERTEDGRAVRRALELRTISEQTGLDETLLKTVVEAFQREGFLIVTQSSRSPSPLSDISHEAVARQWVRLGNWMDAEARGRRALRRIREAAAEWNEHGRNKAYLFRGLQLASAEAEVRGRERRLDSTAAAFLAAARRSEFWGRIFSPKVLLTAVALVIAIAAVGMWGFVQADRLDALSRTSRAEAERQRLQIEMEAIKARQAESAAAEAMRARSLNPQRPVPVTESGPRVYIQIRGSDQMALARELVAKLRAAGFVAPKPEVVSVGPSSNEVRYFRPQNAAKAKEICDLLAGAGVRAEPVAVTGIKQGPVQPLHFELWLAPAPGTPPPLSDY
jgi:energy-coupling factor transporter ATP-binding protein EcfA2